MPCVSDYTTLIPKWIKSALEIPIATSGDKVNCKCLVDCQNQSSGGFQ